MSDLAANLCSTPIDGERLVSYWAGELAAADEEALEEHVMGCAVCARESARVAAITEAVRGLLPPIVSQDQLRALRERGLRIDERAARAEERNEVRFSPGIDLVVLRLAGLRLAHAARVDCSLRTGRTGDEAERTLIRLEGVPFERGGDAVLLACSRHYDVYPKLIVAEVSVVDADGAATTTRFTLDHFIDAG